MAFGSAVPGAVAALLGIEQQPPGLQAEGASWKTRLKKAAYTSPSGKRIEFAYENVSQELTKRTAGFDFPGVDGSYVQDNGYSARRYPLRCIFWGSDHDTIAKGFIALLLETGAGTLEHPMYGTLTVVPFGDITRRDDLVDAANESKIEVTFFTTTGAVYPSSPIAPKDEIQNALDEFNAAMAAQFDEQRGTLKKGVVADANLKAKIRGALTTASKYLSKVAAVNNAAIKDFRDVQSDINFGIDILVGQPLQLAAQMIRMYQAPAAALAAIGDRLTAYSDMADSLFNSAASSGAQDSSVLDRVRQKLVGDFQVDDLTVLSAVSGSVASVVNNTFTTKPEALSAAEAVLEQLDAAIAWRDERYDSLSQVDTGEAYQALQRAVSLVAGYLIQISSTLIPERAIVLDRNRTVIDVCAELYGTISNERLEFLISSNDLSGAQILELERGTKIKYYVN